MYMEGINNHLEEELPFNVLKMEPEKISTPKIKDHTLFLNGEKFGDYNYPRELRVQNSGIMVFDSSDKDDSLIETHFFNPETGDTDFPVVSMEGGVGKSTTKVNGFHWKSLDNQKFYSGHILATVDPKNKGVVFRTNNDSYDSRDKNCNKIIEGGIDWKNKFQHIQKAESYNGDVVVIANKEGEKASLYINDKEWTYPAHPQKEDGERERSLQAVTNGKNLVVLDVVSNRSNKGKYLEHIFVGDKNGAHTEWNTSFDFSNDKKIKMAVGDDSNSVAVVGDIEGEPTLVIDDLACKLSSTPMSVEKLRVEKDGVFVQYTTAIGKVIAEKVSLKENSKQVQEKNKKIKESKDGLKNLHDFINNEGHTPEKLLEVIKSIEDVKGKLNSVEQSYQAVSISYRKVQDEKFLIEQENKELKNDNEIANEQLEIMKDNNRKLEQQLLEIKNILKFGKMQGLLAKDFIVSGKDNLAAIKKIIES